MYFLNSHAQDITFSVSTKEIRQRFTNFSISATSQVIFFDFVTSRIFYLNISASRRTIDFFA